MSPRPTRTPAVPSPRPPPLQHQPTPRWLPQALYRPLPQPDASTWAFDLPGTAQLRSPWRLRTGPDVVDGGGPHKTTTANTTGQRNHPQAVVNAEPAPRRSATSSPPPSRAPTTTIAATNAATRIVEAVRPNPRTRVDSQLLLIVSMCHVDRACHGDEVLRRGVRQDDANRDQTRIRPFEELRDGRAQRVRVAEKFTTLRDLIADYRPQKQLQPPGRGY